jgi:hypothetical protein
MLPRLGHPYQEERCPHPDLLLQRKLMMKMTICSGMLRNLTNPSW